MSCRLHREKIALADKVLIVDVGGVIGDATAAEACHAANLGRPVRYWSAEGPASRASLVDPVVALRECHHVQRLVMNEVPTLDVPDEIKALRCALIEEEAAELREALDADDIVEVADTVADLLYVAYGAALTFGIPVGAVFSEVHRSNMTKLADAGEPIMRADGKSVKGRTSPRLISFRYCAVKATSRSDRSVRPPRLVGRRSVVMTTESSGALSRTNGLRAPTGRANWS